MITLRLTRNLCRLSAKCASRDLAKCLSTDAPRPVALRSRKRKPPDSVSEYFIDDRHIRVEAGRGGDGCVNFMQLWANENAGPDGGDGGNGGHVIFVASGDVNDFKHIETVVRAGSGEKGYPQDCCGKNAKHTVVKVPLGTVVKDASGLQLGDLDRQGALFIAARGGAGGHGNHFFASDKLQAPHVGEYGAPGESFKYILELKSMAHIGLVGMPNAGKSTLLRAISRARPRVASYPFTTLRPHVGVVAYSDYQQISVADLPGLIEGSHLNRGLGVQFLKHAERCRGLLCVVDAAAEEPWTHLAVVHNELAQFSQELADRPRAIVANKMDIQGAEENLARLERDFKLPVIPISAKTGKNLSVLLDYIRKVYDDSVKSDTKVDSSFMT